jgi:hypothetical protein
MGNPSGAAPSPASPKLSNTSINNSANNKNSPRIRTGEKSTINIGPFSNQSGSVTNNHHTVHYTTVPSSNFVQSASETAGFGAVAGSVATARRTTNQNAMKRSALDFELDNSDSTQSESEDTKRRKQTPAAQDEHFLGPWAPAPPPPSEFPRNPSACDFHRVLALPSPSNAPVNVFPNPQNSGQSRFIVDMLAPAPGEVVDGDMIVRFIQSGAFPDANSKSTLHTWADINEVRGWLLKTLRGKLNVLLGWDAQHFLAQPGAQLPALLSDMNTRRTPQDQKALVLWAKSEKKATRAVSFRDISDYTKRLQYFNLQRELEIIDLLDLIVEVEKRTLGQPLANENQWSYAPGQFPQPPVHYWPTAVRPAPTSQPSRQHKLQVFQDPPACTGSPASQATSSRATVLTDKTNLPSAVRPKATSKLSLPPSSSVRPAPPPSQQAAPMDLPIFYQTAHPNTPFFGRYAPADGRWLAGAIPKLQSLPGDPIVKQPAFERLLAVRFMQSPHVAEEHNLPFTDIPAIVDHVKHLSDPAVVLDLLEAREFCPYQEEIKWFWDRYRLDLKAQEVINRVQMWEGTLEEALRELEEYQDECDEYNVVPADVKFVVVQGVTYPIAQDSEDDEEL